MQAIQSWILKPALLLTLATLLTACVVAPTQKGGTVNMTFSGPGPSVKVIPTYPAVAVKHRKEGTNTVKYTVGPKGATSNVHIVKSSGTKALDDASVQALVKSRFLRRNNGKTFTSTIVYKLDK